MTQGTDATSKENPKPERTNRFPCASCGGDMHFNPETQTLTCGYCDNSIDITQQEGDIQEHNFEQAEDLAEYNWGTEKRVIRCESCGAETILDAKSAADFCAFCGSAHVMSNEVTAGISPESLIPFKITGETAVKNFSIWIKKRFFAPNAVKSQHQKQRMMGVYIPCWTYDSETYSTYTGEGGTYYYESHTEWVTENGQRKQVTRTVRKIRWWPTSGTYAKYFDDVLVNASKNIDERLMEKLEPFDFNQLVHYKPEFLSGFLAERYGVSLIEGWEKAKNFIKNKIHSGVVQQINADEVRNLRINTRYLEIKYKHILLPVWVSSYSYKNKVYRYLVNGQTGEVQGTAPISPWKVMAAVVAGLVVIGAAAFIITHVR